MSDWLGKMIERLKNQEEERDRDRAYFLTSIDLIRAQGVLLWEAFCKSLDEKIESLTLNTGMRLVKVQKNPSFKTGFDLVSLQHPGRSIVVSFDPDRVSVAMMVSLFSPEGKDEWPKQSHYGLAIQGYEVFFTDGQFSYGPEKVAEEILEKLLHRRKYENSDRP